MLIASNLRRQLRDRATVPIKDLFQSPEPIIADITPPSLDFTHRGSITGSFGLAIGR